ncbi:MAG: hypothetical protein QM723_23485 [Myxococcaceae bacterium]
MSRGLLWVGALALAACPAKEAAPKPAPVAHDGEQLDPPSPAKVTAPEWPSTQPVAVKPLIEPAGACVNLREVPSDGELNQVREALETAAADDAIVTVLADGCARLRQLKSGGKVLRWRLTRLVAGSWVTTADWVFVAGLERPTTIGRYSLAAAIDRPNEWVREEIASKRFTRYGLDGKVVDETELLRYPGEPSLYQAGSPARKISSTTPYVHCRTDGSNHCDRMEQRDRWGIEGNDVY